MFPWRLFFHLPFSTLSMSVCILCPVRVLHAYTGRMKIFTKSDQLFISWAKSHRGMSITKQCLSHWIVGAINMAYTSKGLQPLAELCAHSTRGIATSWALFNGVTIEEICTAAHSASSITFARFYKLDVPASPMAHTVLVMGSN